MNAFKMFKPFKSFKPYFGRLFLRLRGSLVFRLLELLERFERLERLRGTLWLNMASKS
ncbi:MAG: hypothetical protein HW419_356 [Deltaproteobacteria bacterium]|nr:hypothetical protein [Deltaproteobacteria bacterium]